MIPLCIILIESLNTHNMCDSNGQSLTFTPKSLITGIQQKNKFPVYISFNSYYFSSSLDTVIMLSLHHVYSGSLRRLHVFMKKIYTLVIYFSLVLKHEICYVYSGLERGPYIGILQCSLQTYTSSSSIHSLFYLFRLK